MKRAVVIQYAIYHLPLITIVALIIALLGLGVSESRLAVLRLSGADSPAFLQAMLNALHGHGLVGTISLPYTDQHWLGFHFSPILYAMLPVVAIWPSITAINLAHCLLITGAALPLYMLTKRLSNEAKPALAAALLYLINPFIIGATAWDFHEIAFAPLTMIMLLWAVLEKRRALFIISCLLLLNIKEHYGLAVFFSGLLWAYWHKEVKFGAAVALFGLAALALIIGVIMPHFSVSQIHHMLGGDPAIDRFSWLFNPASWTKILPPLIEDNIIYLALLFVPLLFLPIKAWPLLLPAFADLAVAMLSTNNLMRHVHSYHAAPIIAVLMVASFYALTKYEKLFHIRNKLLLGIAIMTVSITLVTMPYPVSKQHDMWEIGGLYKRPAPEFLQSAEDIKKIIPQTEPVAMQANLMGYFLDYPKLYQFPQRTMQVEWIVQHIAFDLKHNPHVVSMPFNASLQEYSAATSALLRDANWQPVYAKHQLVVWKKTETHASKNQEIMSRIQKWQRDIHQHYCETITSIGYPETLCPSLQSTSDYARYHFLARRWERGCRVLLHLLS